MTPEYLHELADVADPDKLWRRAGIDREKFTPEQRRQLDMGVALRRHATHIGRLRGLLGTGKSLLLTPLSLSGTDIRDVPMPSEIKKRLERETADRHGSPARMRPLREGEVMAAYMEFDRRADKTWPPAEYLLRFGAAVSAATVAANATACTSTAESCVSPAATPSQRRPSPPGVLRP